VLRYLQIRFNATEAARADRGLQEKRVNDASVVNVVCESLHIHRCKFLAPESAGKSGKTSAETECQLASGFCVPAVFEHHARKLMVL
jgi:hypothetical protein